MNNFLRVILLSDDVDLHMWTSIMFVVYMFAASTIITVGAVILGAML